MSCGHRAHQRGIADLEHADLEHGDSVGCPDADGLRGRRALSVGAAGCLLFCDQLPDVRQHLVCGGVRTVAEALNRLAAVVVPHHAAEADHGADRVSFRGRTGLINGDALRAQDSIDYLE